MRAGRCETSVVSPCRGSPARKHGHAHGVFLDGLFAEGAGGELSFADLPMLSNLDVCEVLSAIVEASRPVATGTRTRPVCYLELVGGCLPGSGS